MAVCIAVNIVDELFDLMNKPIDVSIAGAAAVTRGRRVSRGRRSCGVPGWRPRGEEPSHRYEKVKSEDLGVNLSLRDNFSAHGAVLSSIEQY